MFNKQIYIDRRNKLRKLMNNQTILILGNSESPRNYTDNTYKFRQNSHFLYFAGHSIPDMALLLTPNEDILLGYNPTIDDIIWTGNLPSLEQLGEQVGISQTLDISKLAHTVQPYKSTIHYLPPYRSQTKILLSELLDIPIKKIDTNSSAQLSKAVTDLRLYKSKEEIAEIEKALDASFDMYKAAAKAISKGKKEWDVMISMEYAALKHGCFQSFHPIVTTHGEVLHNHGYNNILSDTGLILLDSGAETTEGYASDITRTFPINGKFSTKEKDVYEVVLASQLKAISICKPSISYKDVHLEAARVIADGLKSIGLMKGDTNSAVEAGAHALFFPHGLGHMMGLDVHDMEDLGDIVGYGQNLQRSSQFGLAFLRMARKLEVNFVFTIEPGIYFIPALIDKWQKNNIHKDFINYNKLEEYRNFGGIRIEDDILITQDSRRVLGNPIPKTVTEIEQLMEQK